MRGSGDVAKIRRLACRLHSWAEHISDEVHADAMDVDTVMEYMMEADKDLEDLWEEVGDGE
jgi:hypothetical protein